MDLYDVKARRFHSPLNYREISQLYRGGQIGGRLPCKPRGEAKWRTLDEVFPLLKYEAAAPPFRFEESGHSRKKGPFISACALVLGLLGTATFHFWIQSAPTAAREQRKQPQPSEPILAQFASTGAITSSNKPVQPLGQGAVIADQTRVR